MRLCLADHIENMGLGLCILSESGIQITAEFSNFQFLANYCRLTKWMSSDVGGLADKETLQSLYNKFGAQTCLNPAKIRVRRVGTRKEASAAGGPQKFLTFDTTVGFQCLASMQQEQICFDYEVQLCCPGM